MLMCWLRVWRELYIVVVECRQAFRLVRDEESNVMEREWKAGLLSG